jgi:hypothetical protein
MLEISLIGQPKSGLGPLGLRPRRKSSESIEKESALREAANTSIANTRGIIP